MTPRHLLHAACVALLLTTGAAAAQAQAPAQSESAPAPTSAPVAEPSAALLAGGLLLSGASLAMNIHSAVQYDEGVRGCFEPGACFLESLLAAPVASLGALGVLMNGYQRGEHAADRDLAAGRLPVDYGRRRALALTGAAIGYAGILGANIYVSVRTIATIDPDACDLASRDQRPDACGGGPILGPTIVQTLAAALLFGSVAPLGFAQGYKKRLERDDGVTLILPFVDDERVGLTLLGTF